MPFFACNRNRRDSQQNIIPGFGIAWMILLRMSAVHSHSATDFLGLMSIIP